MFWLQSQSFAAKSVYKKSLLADWLKLSTPWEQLATDPTTTKNHLQNKQKVITL